MTLLRLYHAETREETIEMVEPAQTHVDGQENPIFTR